MKKIDYVKYKNTVLGIVLRPNLVARASKFFSPQTSSLQLGIIMHKKGYKEAQHIHKRVKRVIFDVEQFLEVRKGRGCIDFFVKNKKIRSVMLKKGDAIVIIKGIHALRTFQDFEALTIKQGPFLGDKLDKQEVRFK